MVLVWVATGWKWPLLDDVGTGGVRGTGWKGEWVPVCTGTTVDRLELGHKEIMRS